MAQTIKITELNNKTRKGLYAYVKKNNKKGKYYKIQPGIPIKTLIKYYETKNKNIRHKPRKRKNRPKINTLLKKGIKTVNVKPINQQGTQKALQKLFKNIIKDQELTKILLQESNLEKIKHRLSYTLTLYDKKGTKLATATNINITPQKATNQTKTINKNEQIIGNYQSLKKLKNQGWQVNEHQNGTIHHKKLTITFRKAN